MKFYILIVLNLSYIEVNLQYSVLKIFGEKSTSAMWLILSDSVTYNFRLINVNKATGIKSKPLIPKVKRIL